MTNDDINDPFADTCGHPVCNPGHCNCHLETRAQDFLTKAADLNLEESQIHVVLDDLLDVAPANHDRMLALHEFGLTLVTSDDDYDDFRREVCGILAGDDACDACGLDPDDCECDDDED